MNGDYLAVWFAVFNPEGQTKRDKHRDKRCQVINSITAMTERLSIFLISSLALNSFCKGSKAKLIKSQILLKDLKKLPSEWIKEITQISLDLLHKS